LADIMEDLSPTERHAIIASLDEESAAGALTEMDARLTSQVVENLAPDRAADILEEMEPDMAADVLAGLSPEVSEDVLEEMPGEEAREVKALLRFDENSAGGMMNTEFVFVGETATRADAVGWLASQDVKLEQLDTIFLINGDAQLAGAVPVARLLLAHEDQPMSELTSEPLVSLLPDADQKEVFEIFDKYNLRSLSVVNEEGRPIGVITVDDVVSRLRRR